LKIGVLALQGAFIEHMDVLHRLEIEASPVNLPEELYTLDGLIIPGGESTTIGRLMLDYKLVQPVRDLARKGLPILGTCAGLVLMAQEVLDFNLKTLGLMDMSVKRNAFGSQVDSFETEIKIPVLDGEPFHGIFIRAPIIERTDPEVEILARLADGVVVATRQGKLVAVAFHPELTDDLRFHRYFLDIVASGK
jgi:5'-phosphate synthase pdxT subunit